jgi:hypothetical protein
MGYFIAILAVLIIWCVLLRLVPKANHKWLYVIGVVAFLAIVGPPWLRKFGFI